MPKTDVKKIESEDLKELSDEALDRADAQAQMSASTCFVPPCCHAPSD